MENNKQFVDNFQSSKLEDIDYAIFDWVDKEINVQCNTSEGFRKVPVIWAGSERAYQIKNYKDLRDKDGTLITPFISVERKGINKSLDKTKGAIPANIKGFDRIGITTIINQEKTSKYASNAEYNRSKKINYAIKKNPKVVYQTKFVRLPTYFEIDYEISIKTSFIQQINEILQPFITFTRIGKYFYIKKDNNRFEAAMGESYDSEQEANLESEERFYITKFTIKVTGYFIGEDINQNDQKVITYENPVDIKFPRQETFIMEEELLPASKRKSPVSQLGETASALKKVYLIGNNIDSVFTVNHNLNSRDIYISVRENFGTYSRIEAGIVFTDPNNVSIDMGSVIDTNSHTVLIIG